MIITHKLQLYLDQLQETATIEAVQGDTTRAIELSLYAQGEPWSVPTDAEVLVRYRKSDGTGGYYDTLPDGNGAWNIYGSTVTVRLAPQVLSVAGIVELQVVLRRDEDVLATFTVLVRVQSDPSLGTVESEDYVNLTNWIRNELDNQMTEAMDSGGYINAKVENLFRLQPLTFTAGSLESGTGAEVEEVGCIRSGFIRTNGREISLSFPTGMLVQCIFYDAQQSYVSETGFSPVPLILCEEATYVRCAVTYSENPGELDQETMDGMAQKFALCFLSDSHDAFQGDLALVPYPSLAYCSTDGYYRFAHGDLAAFSDAPQMDGDGILEVHSRGSQKGMVQTIRTLEGEVWIRESGEAFRRIVPSDATAYTQVSTDSVGPETAPDALSANTTVCVITDSATLESLPEVTAGLLTSRNYSGQCRQVWEPFGSVNTYVRVSAASDAWGVWYVYSPAVYSGF